MRTCVLADGQRTKKPHKKYDENIGRHLKKKKIGTPKVFQRLYVFHLYAQRNHSLSGAIPKLFLCLCCTKIIAKENLAKLVANL
jgi:hypothetical protein